MRSLKLAGAGKAGPAQKNEPVKYAAVPVLFLCPVENLEFVSILENLLGRKATIIDAPTPPSEPLITYADVSKAGRLIGYKPHVSVADGLAKFVTWMKQTKLT